MQLAVLEARNAQSVLAWHTSGCSSEYCMQLAVLEARSKGWGRIGQAPKGRSQSAPRGVPRSRIAIAGRPAPITVRHFLRLPNICVDQTAF